MTIHLGDNKTLNITTSRLGDTSFYLHDLRVNGKEWDKSWVAWEDIFAEGATMEFVLGNDPSNWPRLRGPPPPSPASGDSRSK
jgi:putative alpha-1,2-mannosidase